MLKATAFAHRLPENIHPYILITLFSLVKVLPLHNISFTLWSIFL